MRAGFMLQDRSDQELLEGVWAAVTRECEDVAIVIAHLAEIDKRKLFAEEGCSSLKSYCMEVLHLSEDQAYSRIDVARVARKFPIVLEMLADGLVHLTAVHRLGPSLTQDNHLSILEEATHKSMAKVEAGPGREAQGEHVRPSPTPGSAVFPLAPESYKIEFTGDAETVYALRQLQELLSHQVPNGDLAVIIKDALLERLKQVERERFGKGKRPRSRPEASERVAGEPSSSRYISLEIKNAVWERDQGHCAFVARNGRQCSERRWIEFHHIVPFAWGGQSTVDNIELRCRTHNAYEGELIFGKVVRKSKRWALPASTGFKTSSASGTGPVLE